MAAGHRELGMLPLDDVARVRGWSDARVANARRLIDGGMGERLGQKHFEETTFGAGDDALEGSGWVYYLYEERIDEVDALI